MERPTRVFNSAWRQFGFTLLSLLFAVFLVGLALSGAAVIWQIEQQREKERVLLFVGQQYIDAIASYYHAAPVGVKKYPRRMQDLLKDPRYILPKHHLRKIWLDPMTGSSTWGMIYTQQGGIAGIYSLANTPPIKQAGFGLLDGLLVGKSSYRDWKFVYIAAMANEAPAEQASQQDASQEFNLSQEENQSSGNPEQEETGEELISSLGLSPRP